MSNPTPGPDSSGPDSPGPDEPLVRYAVADGFAVLTLDSPANRNALSQRLVAQLLDGLRRAGADEQVRAVVLTHSGTTFCAGADLREALDADPAAAADIRTRWLVDVLRTLVTVPKPVVAQVDGHVRAGGMGIVAACDIAVAGRRSSFGLTEARIGLAPFIISLTLLPRMNARAAARYYQTGETFDAAEAQRTGLVTVAADDPDAEVARLCDALRRSSPQGLAESKRLVNAGLLAEFERSADDLAARSGSLFGTPEAVEGMTAFFQRRPPSWAQ